MSGTEWAFWMIALELSGLAGVVLMTMAFKVVCAKIPPPPDAD